MQYQSPIRFLEYAGIDHESAATDQLSRYKKLVAAEFALQTDGIITLEGISYTRYELLKLLEHPGFIQELHWHRTVWQHKGLLNLLERDALDMQEASSWEHLQRNTGFVQFLSPYFAPAFNSVAKTLLQQQDLYTASRWMDYYGFVLPADGEEATRAIRLYLDDTIRLFRNLNSSSYQQRMAELRPWVEENWSLFINKLPEQLLHYTDELANAIINFTVRIQKAHKRMCYRISGELAQLMHVNYSLKQLIENNHAIYKQNYKGGGVRGLLSRVPSAYFIVVMLIALLRSCTSWNDSSSNSFSPPSQRYSSDELAQAYSGILEKEGFLDIRRYYDRQYQAYKQVGNDGDKNKALMKTAFSGKDLYLVMEEGSDSTHTLYPCAIKNNTPGTIQLFMLRSGSVYNLEIRPYNILGLEPARGTNTDLVMAFSPRKDLVKESAAVDTNNLQYIHIAANAAGAYHQLEFRSDLPVELPYLEKEHLDTLPLVITIDRKNERNYFSVSGRGQTAQYRALPGAR